MKRSTRSAAGSAQRAAHAGDAMRFGVYRKVRGRDNPPEGHQSTGVGMLYQFLLLARNHYTGAEIVVYIPLRVEPEWAGTIRPCWIDSPGFRVAL